MLEFNITGQKPIKGGLNEYVHVYVRLMQTACKDAFQKRLKTIQFR